MFPLTTTDSKHDFTNSNERKHSYIWNLMYNSVQRFCKTDSFQNVCCTYNVRKKILLSCCSPSVKFNTQRKKAIIPSWLGRLHQPSRGNDHVISWLASSEIIHIWTHFRLLPFQTMMTSHKVRPVWCHKKKLMMHCYARCLFRVSYTRNNQDA